MLGDHGGAAVGKNLGPPMPKWSNDAYLQENQEL